MNLLKVICFCALALVASSAIAQNGATVIDEFGCGIIPADSGLPVILFSNDSHAVSNYAGNTNFWCDFMFDPALCADDKAMKHKGFLCGTQFGLTTDTMAVTDCEYGTVHLKCQIKAHH